MDRQPGMQRRSISDALLLALKHMPKRKGGPLYRVSYIYFAAFALTTFSGLAPLKAGIIPR